jgi:hypothetical protein
LTRPSYTGVTFSSMPPPEEPLAFYQPVGPGQFVATSATAGPWSPDAQHGGPPAALLARELELFDSDQTKRLARVAIDILRPVPIGKLTVRTAMLRPGRRIGLLEAVMECDGQEVAHARGWRIARSAVPAASASEPADGPMAVPADDDPVEPRAPDFPLWNSGGYLASIEWRFLDGFGHSRPSPAWTRPTKPLIAGEEPTAMSRALLVADSGSGVGSVLDPARFLFINVDLTLVLPRDPLGDWILLQPATSIGPDGTGLTTTVLSDAAGPFGTAMQTLLIAPR